MMNGKSLVGVILFIQAIIGITSLAFVVAVIWVAVHFISKLW